MSTSTPLTSSQIRERFIAYFEAQNHTAMPSSPVAGSDSTLLFTNAGMVQFKDIFAGNEVSKTKRATTYQKCIRAGGKHNDLENVGYTARHHTFFEMLGNFSFGDYFKKDAIRFAWDFLTRELKLDKERLWVSVFAGEEGVPADEEAFQIWSQEMGVPTERILRLGMKDNFWSMGDTGPCGPCSEILYDLGEEASTPGPHAGDPAEDGERYLEVWNLVFMQFNRTDDGVLHELPAPSIDTGMGLERITAVMQGQLSNYGTDLFQPLLQAAAKGVGKTYGANEDEDVSMRVIADHARATSFLIAESVFPSNEGRGYVLRRIMRRAIRHGDRLGYKEPFFANICRVVVETMSGVFPELKESASVLEEVVLAEEKSFRRTLAHGLGLLEKELQTLTEKGQKQLPGEIVFRLYDTFGFPHDLTRLICEEQGKDIDEPGFLACMEAQRERGRDAWAGGADGDDGQDFYSLFEQVGESEFVGYTEVSSVAKVKAILVDGVSVEEINASQKGGLVQVVLDKTPFYGESGGQVGDEGSLETEKGSLFVVKDTKKPLPGFFVHTIEPKEGGLRVGEEVTAVVDKQRRERIRSNHSATHLLHWALREHLGTHVKQAGSLVSPDRLRFDFSHYQAPTPAEVVAIENSVNALIRANLPVETQVKSFDEAKSSGAMALFGEKYGDRVRVVSMGPSVELCGGTHVQATGEIGHLRIVYEQGVAAGTRRIEAYTGVDADNLSQGWNDTLQRVSGLLRCRPQQVVERIEKLQQQVKQLSREVDALQVKVAQAGSDKGDLLDQAKEVDGVRVLAVRVGLGEPKAMRDLADQLRDRLQSGVVVLGGENKGKASICAVVTKDQAPKIHAGKLVKELAAALGGRGGGKPTMAQGGGPHLEQLDQALASVETLVQKMLQAEG